MKFLSLIIHQYFSYANEFDIRKLVTTLDMQEIRFGSLDVSVNICEQETWYLRSNDN